jgi:hypothetical protein
MPAITLDPTGQEQNAEPIPYIEEGTVGKAGRRLLYLIQAIQAGYPNLLSSLTEQILPTEEAKIGAAEKIAPREAALQANLLADYGPKVAGILSGIQTAQQRGAAEGEADVLAGPGRDITERTLELMKLADPEFFSAREKSGAALDELLAPGLTGGERAEVERYLGRSNAARGLLGTPTATSTVENAMTFGGAARDRLSEALARATSFLPASRSGAFDYNNATGRIGRSAEEATFGFPGISEVGNEAFSIGTNLIAPGTSLYNTQAATGKKPSGLEKGLAIGNTAASLASAGGSLLTGKGCCFIFMEAYIGQLPWWIRKSRDYFYTPQRNRGYNRLANFLVPLMTRFTFVRSLVNETMIVPLSAYGGWLWRVPGYESGSKYNGFKKFWFKVFDFLGKF